jgi:hypothetical protein
MDAVQDLATMPDPIKQIISRNETAGRGVSQPQADLNKLTDYKTQQEGDVLQKKADFGIKQAHAAGDIQDQFQTKQQGLQDTFKQEAAQHPVDTQFKPSPPMIADIASIGALMTAVSAMSGGKGRYSAMNSMAAMNGAMEGIHKGDLEHAQTEMDAFNTNQKANAEWHREKLAELKEAMTELGSNRDSAMAKLKMLEAEFEGTVTAQQIRTGNLQGAITNLQGVVKHNEKVQERAASFQQQMQLAKYKHDLGPTLGAAGATLDDKTMSYLGALADKNPKLYSSMTSGWSRNPVRMQGIKEAIAQAISRGESPDQWAGSQTEHSMGITADQGSLNAMTKSLDAVTAFENTAIRNGDRLVELGDKVDSTGVPAIERWIRGGRQATGDPDVAKFNAQMQVYRTEAAKILTNPNLTGQLTDSARHEVEGFLSGASSAEQIRGVVDLLKNDFENRKKTLQNQIKEAQGRHSSAQPTAPTNEDQEAIAWAKSNPSDPRAVKILKMHGVQ